MMVMYLQMFRNFAASLFGFSRIFSSGVAPGLVGMCTAQPPMSSVAGSSNENTAGLVSNVNAAPSNADIDSSANPDMAIAGTSGNVDRESEGWTDRVRQANAENEVYVSQAGKLSLGEIIDCLHSLIWTLRYKTLLLKNCCIRFIDFHDIPANILEEIKDKDFDYERIFNRELCSSTLDDIKETRRRINEFQKSSATNFSLLSLKNVSQDVLGLKPLLSFVAVCHVAPSRKAENQFFNELEAEIIRTEMIDGSYPEVLLLYLDCVERYVRKLDQKARNLCNNQVFVKILPDMVKKSDSDKAKEQINLKLSRIAEYTRKKELKDGKQKKEVLNTEPLANSEGDGLEKQKSKPNENAASTTGSTQVLPNDSVPSPHGNDEKDEVAEVDRSKTSVRGDNAAKAKKLARLRNSKEVMPNPKEFKKELEEKVRQRDKKIKESKALNESRLTNQGIEDADTLKVPSNNNGDNRQDSDSNEEFYSTTESFGTGDEHSAAKSDQSYQPAVPSASGAAGSQTSDDSLLVENQGKQPPLDNFAINKTDEQQNEHLKTTSDEPHDRSPAFKPVYTDEARSDVPEDVHNYHQPTGNDRQQDRSGANKNTRDKKNATKDKSSKADGNKSPQAANPKKNLKPSSKRNYGLIVFFVVGCVICLAVGVFIYLVIFK